METKIMKSNIEIKIEKNIPINNRNAGKLKFPFDKMEVGDSFFVPINSNTTLFKLRQLINSHALYFIRKNRLDHKFSTRKDSDGIRVWRIK